jgi:hypothetical protein
VMAAKTKARGPVYRGSSGSAQFGLPSGQSVKICANDADVVAAMKRRGLWKQAESNVKIGSTFALHDSRGGDMDFFLWVGSAGDGGFAWYSFPGANASSPDVREFIDMMFGGGMFGATPQAGGNGGTYGQTR